MAAAVDAVAEAVGPVAGAWSTAGAPVACWPVPSVGELAEAVGAGAVGAGAAGAGRAGATGGAGVLLAVGAGVVGLGVPDGAVGPGGQIRAGTTLPIGPHCAAAAGIARRSGVSARVRAAA